MNWMTKVAFNLEVERLLKSATAQDAIQYRMQVSKHRKHQNMVAKLKAGNPTPIPTVVSKRPTSADNLQVSSTPRATTPTPNLKKLKDYSTANIADSIALFEGKAVKNSLANRLNNPGNLKFRGQPNSVKGDKGFAHFKDYQAGRSALEKQIRLDAGRGHTLKSFIDKYAPPSENDSKAYYKFVKERT